jgi:3-phenylpropionate/trans-cinnamate dioxygenase ferredoxin component
MFKKLLTYSEIREKSAKSVSVGDIDIAIFKVEGKIYAMKNICPHQHFSHLQEGEIIDGAVSCPMHGWTFDLATGVSRTGQGKVTIYPVQIQGNDILVDIDA